MSSRWRLAIVGCLVMGAILRTAQYAGQVALWHDELAIARNVQDRSLSDLVTRPLDYRQVAPAGFLAAVKVATSVAGVDELGLRAVPWLVGLLSLVLFWRVAARVVSGLPLVAALAIFAASPALVWYGASVKQYGSDLAVSLLLVLLALRVLERPERRDTAALAGLAGGAAMLLSHPAVVTGFVIGCILVAASRGERWPRSRASLLIVGAGWGAGAAVAAAIARALLDPGTSAFMHDFWREGFPPSPSQPLDLLLWVPRQLATSFAHFLLFFTPLPLVLIVVTPIAAAAAVGLPALVRSHPKEAALLSAPLVAGIVAAAAGLLPFRHRLALHAVWPLLLFAAAGLQAIERRLHPRLPRLAPAVACLIAAPLPLMVLLAARPPYDSGQETREAIAALARRWQPGDALYVYCYARHAVAFYGPRLDLAAPVAGNECRDSDPRLSLREVDAFRGRPRVWYFSMRFPGEEATIVRRYLHAIGREDEHLDGASLAGRGGRIIDLHRFDLSDPARLATTSAAVFPVTP